MSTRSLLVARLGALAAALVAGCGGSDPGPPELAFVTSRDGPYSIYVMSADGKAETPLTEGEATVPSSAAAQFFEVDPAWSPDGRRIAFASKRKGTFDLFVTSVDGTGTRRLTSTRADDSDPSWSPDGKRLVFQRGAAADLYVIDAAGGNARRVGTDTAEELDPAWSPDGRWIVFQRRAPGTPIGELWLVRPDGSARRQVTRLESRSYEPAWSPDGKRIAFASTAGKSQFDIYTTGIDGKGLQRVTDSIEDEFEPAWSPDGSTIVFNRDGALVAAQLGGGDERELTDAENNDGSPTWRPTLAAAEDSS
jgi:TolB protein